MQTVIRAKASRSRKRRSSLLNLRRMLRYNGLSIVLIGLFLISWVGQCLTGWYIQNQDQQQHGRVEIPLASYLTSGHFLEATSENWESEFLQMAAFVWLTSFLFQKGSPESRDPDESPEHHPLAKNSPWSAKQGGWIRKLYENSLSLTLFVLFLICFILHAASGAREFSQQQIDHGSAGVTLLQYMGTSKFWFESFQNWQSEFLSIGVMVILAIFLRQQGSPESKPVESSHWQND